MAWNERTPSWAFSDSSYLCILEDAFSAILEKDQPVTQFFCFISHTHFIGILFSPISDQCIFYAILPKGC